MPRLAVRLAFLVPAVVLASLSPAFGQATLDELVHRAHGGFLGRVESISSRWGDASRSWMETDYVFAVDEVIVNDGRLAAGSKATLTIWGGKIGKRRHYVASQPGFVKGERYVLLLNEGYAKPGNLSPLVKGSEGFFAVTRPADGTEEIVVDRFGEPVVTMGQAKAVRLAEARQRKVAAEPVTPKQLVEILRGDLQRIKAIHLPAEPVRTAREGAKLPARPQGASRRAADAADRVHRLPQAMAPKGVVSPAAPRAVRIATGGDGAVPKAASADRSRPKFMTALPAELPMIFNLLPKTDEFTPWGGVDENCTWFWNQYFPNSIRMYDEQYGEVAYENGIHDVHGFLNEEQLYQRFGLDGWNGDPFAVMVVEEDGLTLEADIAFNASLQYTLDDEAVYAGESPDFAFRRLATQAFGFALGLDWNNFPSLMSVPNQIEWDGLHYPMGDDINGLHVLYPDARREKSQDLILHLFWCPGDYDWQQSTFPAEVAAGAEMKIGMYMLENAGTAEAPRPIIDWYLCRGRNWGQDPIPLGRSTYGALPAGNFFYTDEHLDIVVAVPADTPPGEYYLGAYLRDDPEFNTWAYPYNSNSAFSRTRIIVTKFGAEPPPD